MNKLLASRRISLFILLVTVLPLTTLCKNDKDNKNSLLMLGLMSAGGDVVTNAWIPTEGLDTVSGGPADYDASSLTQQGTADESVDGTPFSSMVAGENLITKLDSKNNTIVVPEKKYSYTSSSRYITIRANVTTSFSDPSDYNGMVVLNVNGLETVIFPYYSSGAWRIQENIVLTKTGYSNPNKIYLVIYKRVSITSDGQYKYERWGRSRLLEVIGSFTTPKKMIQLQWNVKGDVDLHLSNDGESEHCYFSNKTVSGSGYTAVLDYDNTRGGNGSNENITWTGTPTSGKYKIYVNYWSGTKNIRCVVRIWEDGVLTGRYIRYFSSTSDAMNSTYVAGTSWLVKEYDFGGTTPPSSSGSITVTLDGTPRTFNVACSAIQESNITGVTCVDSSNNAFQITFDGFSTGTYLSSSSSYNFIAYYSQSSGNWQTLPLYGTSCTINVTSYGSVGGTISGTFNGSMNNASSPSSTMSATSGTFSVQRLR